MKGGDQVREDVNANPQTSLLGRLNRDVFSSYATEFIKHTMRGEGRDILRGESQIVHRRSVANKEDPFSEQEKEKKEEMDETKSKV